MLETPHVIVGAAIAAKVTNPLLSIPLAVGSHFLLDMVPHWNPHINTELQNGGITKRSKKIIALDVAVSLVAGFMIATSITSSFQGMFIILLGALAGVLPDLVEGPYFFLGWRHKILLKWLKWQKAIQVDAAPFAGILTQVAVVVAALWWIYS